MQMAEFIVQIGACAHVSCFAGLVSAMKVPSQPKKRKSTYDEEDEPADFNKEMHKMLECFGGWVFLLLNSLLACCRSITLIDDMEEFEFGLAPLQLTSQRHCQTSVSDWSTLRRAP